MIIIFQYCLCIRLNWNFYLAGDGTLTNSRGTSGATVRIFLLLLVSPLEANCNSANNIVALYTGYWIIADGTESRNRRSSVAEWVNLREYNFSSGNNYTLLCRAVFTSRKRSLFVNVVKWRMSAIALSPNSHFAQPLFYGVPGNYYTVWIDYHNFSL